MSRLLVTGGAGFIGSRIVAGALAAGSEVRVLDRSPRIRGRRASYDRRRQLVPADDGPRALDRSSRRHRRRSWPGLPKFGSGRYDAPDYVVGMLGTGS